MENGNAPVEKSLRHPRLKEIDEEIESIELTEPEAKYALWIGKKHKYHAERNAPYWKEKEAKNPGKASW